MALQLFADGAVAYDSRLEDYTLLGLKTTSGLNKGGTAEIVMPPGHPAYNSFTSYKTIVTLRENGALRFRGRALYPTDDFYNLRTITCEGERCFLRDAVIRPYLYMADPASIFAAGVNLYNAEVDDFKRFTLGECTVTDANDYIRMESESAETFADFFDKLVARCGGYIVFTDAPDGTRAINWLAEIGTRSGQTIEFGENLLEFARSGQSTELATAVLPYGAQLEDGTRVTIESVTEDGADYIQDDEAVALRGRIMAIVTWDDVTEPANLLRKAQEWLETHKLAVVALELTAADLSRMDKDIDSYQVGDLVQVISKPHGVNGWFQLTERTTDWLQHDGGSISLGQAVASLTGADVIVQQATNRAISTVKSATVKATNSAGNAAQEVEKRLTSKMEQLAGSIALEVSGGLGNVAAIRLTVDGDSYTETLALDNVRQAFADDPSAITISAGTVTFNAGTFVVNSEDFQVDATGKITATAGTIGAINMSETGIYSYTSGYGSYAGWYRPASIDADTICFFAGATSAAGKSADFSVTYGGKLTATGAEISGTICTESSVYKAQLHSGGLGLYYNDELCGTVNTKYWSGASVPGISLRIEEAGKYIMFSHPSDAGTGYDVDYYLNYGWSTNYVEKHIFQTSARFLDKLYWSNAYARGLYLYENVMIKACDADGTATEELIGYDGSRVDVGSSGCTMMLRGTTVYLKNTSTTVTSDRNAKRDIEELPEKYEAFLDALRPVRYKYKEGTSGRYHTGYIAQDVAAALEAAGLTPKDFAGYVCMSDTGELGLQYTEFVALLHAKIKRLEQRIEALTTAKNRRRKA